MSDLDIEKQGVSVEFIEALLRRRHNGVDQRYHEDETADLAKVIAGVADDSTQNRAAGHLERCSECREVLLALHWADAVERDENVPTLSGRNALGRLAIRSGRWGRISAAAVVVVALAFLISMIMPRDQHREVSLRIKGRKDNLVVAVGRDMSRFVAKPLDRLKENDRLGLFYSAERAGYLAVINFDSAGRVSVLFPADQKVSGAIERGQDISLADGAIVEEGVGCEWIVGVFSDSPLALDDILNAIENREKLDGLCGMRLKIKDARAVKSLPFLR